MIGFIRARAQLRAVVETIDCTMPHIQDDDPAKRVGKCIGDLRRQVVEAKRECENLRHRYEPTRERQTLDDGASIVRPVGMSRQS